MTGILVVAADGWIPAFAGMTIWAAAMTGLGDGCRIAADGWIPAFAGMTIWAGWQWPGWRDAGRRRDADCCGGRVDSRLRGNDDMGLAVMAGLGGMPGGGGMMVIAAGG